MFCLSFTNYISVNSYLGIPYAAPPVGDLRWRAPVPISQHNNYTKGNILKATTHTVQCVQGLPQWSTTVPLLTTALPGGASIESSEDCLHLDILTPSDAQSSDLPVPLNIHGGGYTLGNGANAGGPNFVSRSNGSLIFVSIQYRLGGYGFLSSDPIQEDGSANTRLLDQRTAIGWAQRNICAFGGDLSKTTIWGGSAGGGAIID
ncbi:hypothetical protein E4T42_08797 [Aureobasidium subglaciale]|nr:hypothetical protein E4T42_08797 [Aureobasidium subglaciale]